MLVIAFLPRSKYLLISWLWSLSAVILEPKKIVCYCLHFFPICLPWSRRRRGRQRMRWLDGITDLMDMNLSELLESWWWTGRPGVLRFMGSQRIEHDWATELNWLSSTIINKHQFFSAQPSLWSNSQIHIWLLEIIALTVQTFVGKVTSLLFNTLYRFVRAFFPSSKCLF